MRFDKRGGLVHLSNAFSKIRILSADIPNQLLKLLSLDLLHPLNTTPVDEWSEFSTDEDEPVEMLVNRRKAQNLAIQRLRIKSVKEFSRVVITLFRNLHAPFMRTLGCLRKIADSLGTVERRWCKIIAPEAIPLQKEPFILLEALSRLLIML